MEPPAPQPKRVKRRWVIPLVILGLLGAVALAVYLRGNWADTVLLNPKSPAEGILVQLYQAPDGHKEVRGAVVLDAPPERVWSVVTDYPRHDKIHRYVSKIEVKREENGSYHLNGIAHSRLWGDWPYDVHVFHDEAKDKDTYRAYWDGPSGAITVNKGAWTVSPAGDGKTLLTYTLEIEVGDYPTFVIRNLLLDRLAKIIDDVGTAVKQGPAAP